MCMSVFRALNRLLSFSQHTCLVKRPAALVQFCTQIVMHAYAASAQSDHDWQGMQVGPAPLELQCHEMDRRP